MGKLAGFIVVVGAGYAAFHFLFGHGWLGTSACILIWFLLASLYKPHPRARTDQIPMPGIPYESPWTDEEKKALFGKRESKPTDQPKE
jgi:hypothetical protein